MKLRELLPLALGRDLDHVPGEPGPLHRAHDPCGRVELPPAQAWTAERGNAWWLWCQDSPNDSSDSQKTLVEWSSTANRRVPKKWQTELIDQVTWWSRKIRTAPP